VNGIRNALGQGNATAETNITKIVKGKEVVVTEKGNSLIGTGDAYSTWILMSSVGGKPMNPNAGFFVLTELAIQELNARAKMPNTNFHALLKSLRKAKDKPFEQSIRDRYDSFFNQGTPTKTEWERMRDAGIPQNQRFKGTVLTQRKPEKPRTSLIVNNTPHLDDTDNDDTSIIETGVLLFIGAKIFNIF
jgi:hypothetical protein